MALFGSKRETTPPFDVDKALDTPNFRQFIRVDLGVTGGRIQDVATPDDIQKWLGDFKAIQKVAPLIADLFVRALAPVDIQIPSAKIAAIKREVRAKLCEEAKTNPGGIVEFSKLVDRYTAVMRSIELDGRNLERHRGASSNPAEEFADIDDAERDPLPAERAKKVAALKKKYSVSSLVQRRQLIRDYQVKKAALDARATTIQPLVDQIRDTVDSDQRIRRMINRLIGQVIADRAAEIVLRSRGGRGYTRDVVNELVQRHARTVTGIENMSGRAKLVDFAESTTGFDLTVEGARDQLLERQRQEILAVVKRGHQTYKSLEQALSKWLNSKRVGDLQGHEVVKFVIQTLEDILAGSVRLGNADVDRDMREDIIPSVIERIRSGHVSARALK